MTRAEFLRLSALMGIGAPLIPGLLSSCAGQHGMFEAIEPTFSGKVLVIGAGTAGLVAGHTLKQYGIPFEIVEASNRFGGRVMGTDTFTEFPIDLGAEWIHTDPSVLAKLAQDNALSDELDIITYNPQTYQIWKKDQLKQRNYASNFYSEFKFKRSSWYEFLAQYVLPPVADHIRYESPVEAIDYRSDQIEVRLQGGKGLTADKVILTVPLTVLKAGEIDFDPPLPTAKIDALAAVEMPDGIKMFMEFSERFYPDLLGFDSLFSTANGEITYYDAAFGKESDQHIFALFAVGEPATPYAAITDEEQLLEYVLAELDEMYDGTPSRTYQQHIIQNWSQEPFIRGSYAHYQDYRVRETLGAPIDSKVFFAGEAYADNTSTVHGAGESAFAAVKQLLES